MRHADIVFADVNWSNMSTQTALLRATVAQQQQQGRRDDGDWPCIRYYNGATGVEGEDYIRKRSQQDLRLCEELGPRHHYLLEWVTQVAGPLCDVVARESSCDERSLRFLKTVEEQDVSANSGSASNEENGGDNGEMTALLLERLHSQLSYFQSQVEKNPGNWDHWNRANMLEQLIAVKEQEFGETIEEL